MTIHCETSLLKHGNLGETGFKRVSKRLGGKRGAGVPGCGDPGSRGKGSRGHGVWKTRGLVENAGSGGIRGVWWKTRGLVENAGSNVENTGNHYFSTKYALSSLK